jgi:hypothetical protein
MARRCYPLVLVSSAVGVAIVAISISAWQAARLPVNRGGLKRLRPGNSQSEVRRVLGAPTQIWTDNMTWSYSAQKSRYIVYVIFDTNLLFKRYELDD